VPHCYDVEVLEMRVRKAVQKIVALGVGVSMVGATILGAMAADLSEYPDPLFVKNGQFDGVIVVGDRAAAEDVVGAINIATSLQYAVGQPVAVPTQPGGRGGTLAVSGDAVPISEPNNLLEIRERIGTVKETLTEFDLAGLQGGTIVTDEGSTDYNQYLRFDDSTNTTSAEYIPGGTVTFEEDEDDIVGDYLKFVDGQDMFEYELEFEEGVESDLQFRSGTTGPKELDDLEDEELNMLGKVFSIVDTRAFHNGGASVKLDLLGGDVLDTLEEGETRTYTIDGKEYEVSLVIVSDNRESVKFNVNGEITDELVDGDTDVLRDGTEIGIREILPNEADEETGGDLVEFFLGANKVSLEDTNFTDDVFNNGGVEVHQESIEDARVKIKASNQSDTMEIQTIQYRVKADSPKGDIFVPPGHGVREYLDEPESMLSDAWDIRYEGLADTGVSIIRLDAAGDDSYDLHFTNRQGLEYVVPFVDNSRDEVQFFKYGDDDNDLLFKEGLINNSLVGLNVANGSGSTTLGDGEIFWINNTGINDSYGNVFVIDEDDFFVLTDSGGQGYVDSGDETSFTHILSYETIDTTNTKITFNDEGTGQREVKYDSITTITGVTGRSQTLIVGGNTYDVYVSTGQNGSGSSGDGRYPLAIDQNSDGVVDGQEVHVVVNGGGILDLGAMSLDRNLSDSGFADAAVFVDDSPLAGHTASNLSNGRNGFQVNLTTLASEFDGNGIQATGIAESIHVNITTPSSTRVDLVVPSPQNLTSAGQGAGIAVNDTQLVIRMESLDEEDLRQGLSAYGVFLEQTDETDTNDADDLTIEYPLAQRGADVFVTIGSTQTTRVSAAAGGSAVVLNPISVGSAKLASEVAGQEMRMNMIVVGGPCINSAAATLMGSSEPLCGAASGLREGQGVIKLFENGENVAMLVAGWSKEDTRRATRVVSEYEDWADKLVGMEVVVTGTSLSDIDVSAPAPASTRS